MHATEFLSKNATIPDVPVLVMYGTERYLKLQTLNLIPGLEDDTEDVALTRTAGKDADLKSVCDELLTVSMFGDKRIVMIDDADDFVSQHRAGLEKYVANPSKKMTAAAVAPQHEFVITTFATPCRKYKTCG